MKMKFKDRQHELGYKELTLKAGVKEWDKERQTLFYLLSLFEETRNHITDLYNFNENWIEFEGLEKGWQTGGTTKVTKLAFNLYNGWNGEDSEDYSPLHLFSVSDNNREYLLEAIKIRFSQ